MRAWLKNLLCLCLVLFALSILLPSISAKANGGAMGENVDWSFQKESGILTIYGTGNMADYSRTVDYYPPWEEMDGYINEIVISEGITSVGAEAFFGCPNLLRVTLPSTLQVIRDSAFMDCPRLKGLSIPYGVTAIGFSAFSGCESIRSMTIPDTVTSIGDRAFADCIGLRTVILPTEPKKVESNIFAGCAGLSEVYFRGSAPSVEVLTESWRIPQRTGVTLHFIEGQKGWTTPTFNGFATQNWSGLIATDVEPTDYFYQPVQWALESGITTGAGKDLFRPEDSCTRGQVVTFLWRAAGSPEPETTESSFTDISRGDYYYKAILWAVEQGITTGVSKGRFAPKAICTRGQVVTFLWRAQGKPLSASETGTFIDVPANSYYAQAVSWAVEQGITNGVGEDRFGPGGLCTRGQIVTFLWRTAGEPGQESGLEPYYDFIREQISASDECIGGEFVTGQVWDLDGNGIKELILWYYDENHLFAMGDVYTIRNGAVEPLLQRSRICAMVGGNMSECGVTEIHGDLYFFTLARYYEPIGYEGYAGAESWKFVWNLFSLRNGEMIHVTDVEYQWVEAFGGGSTTIIPEETYATVDGERITAEEYKQWLEDMDVVLSFHGCAMNYNEGNGFDLEELLSLCQ